MAMLVQSESFRAPAALLTERWQKMAKRGHLYHLLTGESKWAACGSRPAGASKAAGWTTVEREYGGVRPHMDDCCSSCLAIWRRRHRRAVPVQGQ